MLAQEKLPLVQLPKFMTEIVHEVHTRIKSVRITEVDGLRRLSMVINGEPTEVVQLEGIMGPDTTTLFQLIPDNAILGPRIEGDIQKQKLGLRRGDSAQKRGVYGVYLTREDYEEQTREMVARREKLVWDTNL